MKRHLHGIFSHASACNCNRATQHGCSSCGFRLAGICRGKHDVESLFTTMPSTAASEVAALSTGATSASAIIPQRCTLLIRCVYTMPSMQQASPRTSLLDSVNSRAYVDSRLRSLQTSGRGSQGFLSLFKLFYTGALLKMVTQMAPCE
jgi:hypothetical protein